MTHLGNSFKYVRKYVSVEDGNLLFWSTPGDDRVPVRIIVGDNGAISAHSIGVPDPKIYDDLNVVKEHRSCDV